MTYKNDYLIAADEQAQTVRELLLNHPKLNKNMIDDSFDWHCPLLRINDWFNGRERGYVLNVTLVNDSKSSLNIAFYEHRNSDDLHILVWNQQQPFNPICTVEQADFSGLAFKKNGWNTYSSFRYGEWKSATDFIVNIVWEFLNDPKGFVKQLYEKGGILND